MEQKWYQETPVQAALVSGFCVILAAIVAGVFSLMRATPNPDNSRELASGEWVVNEEVIPELGGYDITWRFILRVDGKSLVGDGTKIRVDGEEPTRGERAARLTMVLTFNGLTAEGPIEEVNYRNETLTGHFKIHFSEDFSSFEGIFERKNGAVGATLAGRKRGGVS